MSPGNTDEFTLFHLSGFYQIFAAEGTIYKSFLTLLIDKLMNNYILIKLLLTYNMFTEVSMKNIFFGFKRIQCLCYVLFLYLCSA